MRVVRGRAGSIDADRAVSRRLLDCAESGETAVRAWRPHRQVAFGRRDARSDGYERAASIARERDFPPVDRDVGGRAVAYTGSTVAFARAEPAAGRGGIEKRYDRATGDLQRALSELGVDTREGEPDDSFCPGTHSLQATGKVVGIAQRVRKGAAVTAGVVLVRDHEAIAGVLQPVYSALGTTLETDSVGSIARAGGESDPDVVARRIEAELVGESEPEVVAAADVETRDRDV
jgi:octanoyl-[GcvH]:protein N-octanoyltransferase